MGKHQRFIENLIHGIFLFLGLVTVGCVLLITVYLILSGIPAIRQIGLLDFLLGDTWESTAKEPSFGILPFILTSIYGTAGAILFGVPVGFFTAVYLAKLAPPKVKAVVESAVSLLAGIPLGGLRSGRYAGAGSGNTAALSCAGRGQSAGGDHRAGHYDPAFHY